MFVKHKVSKRIFLSEIRTPMKSENYAKLDALDESFIGTKDYMGLAYFWNYEYRHSLRDCTLRNRIKIHDAFVKARLVINGESDEHLSIIKKITKYDSKLNYGRKK